MARRFDQNYRVKPRDNLGDPEYWNRRFDDIDRRVSANEDGLAEISGLTAYVEGLALDRLNLILEPALDKIALVSEEGFLLAHSNSLVSLSGATTQTFVIHDEAERKLFTPSPYVTLTREANITDYAFAQTVSWNRETGELVLHPVQIFGNPGTYNDWVIYVGTAISTAVSTVLSQAQAARDSALGYKNDSLANATQTASDKVSTTNLRNEVIGLRDAAAASALAAQLWDPSSYIAKFSDGAYTGQVGVADQPAGTSNSIIANTRFVRQEINNLINGASSALDTLNELAAALGNDQNFSTTMANALAKRLRVDASQVFTTAEKLQARANIGAFGTNSELIGINLNTIVSPGFYFTDNTCTSTPIAATYWHLLVQQGHDGSTILQTIDQASPAVSSRWSRMSVDNGSNWSAWLRQASVEDTEGVGSISIWTGPSVAPSNRLKTNGAVLSRTTYAPLWNFANSSGNLVSEATWVAGWFGAFSTGDGISTFRIPDLRGVFIRGWDDSSGRDSGRSFGSYQADAFASHTHNYLPPTWQLGAPGSSVWAGDPSVGTVGQVTLTGGTETRPRNVALQFLIRYK